MTGDPITGDPITGDLVGDVAAFDLDGTLTRRDTLLPFLVKLCGRRRVGWTLAMQAPSLAWSALSPERSDRAKAAVLARLLAGRALDDVETVVDRYAAGVVTHSLRPETVARVDWHRRRGDTLVVISASPEVYVDPVARRLGFDAALATGLEVVDGRLTGRLVGSNVRGAEKVRRLRAHLDGAGAATGAAGRDGTLSVPGRGRLWAYGNSRGDAELLAAADEAFVMTRRGLVPYRARPR